MKCGNRFLGFDPATGDDRAAYFEKTKLPGDTFKRVR